MRIEPRSKDGTLTPWSGIVLFRRTPTPLSDWRSAMVLDRSQKFPLLCACGALPEFTMVELLDAKCACGASLREAGLSLLGTLPAADKQARDAFAALAKKGGPTKRPLPRYTS